MPNGLYITRQYTGVQQSSSGGGGSNITANLWQSFENAILNGANLGATDHNGTGTWDNPTQGTLSMVSTNALAQRAAISTINGSASTGSFGLQLAKADATNAYVHYNFSPSRASVSLGGWVFVPTWGTDGNILLVGGSPVADTFIVRSSGNYFLNFTGIANGVSITSGNWYWFTELLVNGGTCKLRVYDSSGVQVGTEQTTTGNTNNLAELFLFADFNTNNFTATFYMDNLVIDWTSSTFPLGP